MNNLNPICESCNLEMELIPISENSEVYFCNSCGAVLREEDINNGTQSQIIKD